jgi:DNA-binding MarR family transcriptional regulator
MTASDTTIQDVAAAVQDSVGLLTRRLRQLPVGELTQAESVALARVARDEPTTIADLARAENMRPQSMRTTVAALERRGLLERRPHDSDGRRVLLMVTAPGRAITQRKHTARGEQIARALSSGFSDEDLRQLLAAAPLLERVARNLT